MAASGKAHSMNRPLHVGKFRFYVVDNVGAGHQLVSVFGVVQLLPYGGVVEDEHGTPGGYVKFFGELHDVAGYLAV